MLQILHGPPSLHIGVVWFPTSYAWVQVMSRGRPQDLVVDIGVNAISWVTILAVKELDPDRTNPYAG